jgi:hypothetical protein
MQAFSTLSAAQNSQNFHLAGLEAEVLGAREWILELSMLWQSNQSL